jgi:hypothetical protein
MSDTSPNLNFPYLLASQAQKHVSFNELVNRIDALLMLSVISQSVINPPNAPLDGQRYIIPNDASGEWQNQSGKIAVYQNLGWDYINPHNGFIAMISDEGQLYFYNGSWTKLAQTTTAEVFTKLGIGTNADNENPLAVKLNNALFSAKYASEGGDGNVRFKLNKETTAKTASFIFQNSWSGRAEFGLLGSDIFALKTSVDGNNWNTCFSISTSDNIMNFTNPINFPSFSDSANDIIKVGNSSYIHAAKPIGSDGYNIFIGLNTALNPQKNTNTYDGSYNLGIGYSSLRALSTGFNNVGIGSNSLLQNTTGAYNSAIGADSLRANVSGNLNTAVGKGALQLSTGDGNIAIGVEAANANTSGNFNTTIGVWALYTNTTGSYNTAVGSGCLRYKTDGTNNTSFSNCSGIGNDARVSASNQVQLGGSGTTTYAYGAVQDRSDARDKADIRDTILGLNFICALRPVDFKWDMRDDYFDKKIQIDDKGIEQTILTPSKKDGSRKRNRYHHGLIAQEMKQSLDNLGIDFGGYQNHALNGGADVLSIGYTELIAPLIKAVQELSEEIEKIKIGKI